MANYLIYNSGGSGTQILGANLLRYYDPSCTVYDINGIASTTIGIALAALVDDTYDNIWICATTQTAPAAGVITFDQVALLDSKLVPANKAAIIESDTCRANAVVTDIILAATANPNNDHYNGLYVRTAGVTAVSRYITDYTGLTKTAVVSTTTVAVTNTETYEIYDRSQYISLYGNASPSGKNCAYNVFEGKWANTTIPLVVFYVGGWKHLVSSGTAGAACTVNTITLAANVTAGDRATDVEHDTNDYYNGMWVYIYTATTGATQVRQITDYDGGTHVCTLASNWSLTPDMLAAGATFPTGTVLYRIVDNTDEAGYDRATDIAIRGSMWDITSAQAISLTKRFVDNYNSLAFNPQTTGQDLDYLWNDFIVAGKAAAIADAYGIV